MSSPALLETHLKSSHGTETLGNRLPAIIDSCKRPKQAVTASSCPFCDDAEAKALSLDPNLEKGKVLVPTIVFARHVASHMEQLALFAIPRDTGDSDDDRATNRNANINSIQKSRGESESSSIAPLERSQVSKVLDEKKENERLSDSSSTGATMDQKDDPRLHQAAFEGLESEVFQLLDLGENINSQGPRWGSALGAAVIGQHAILAKRLIDRGADLSAPCGKYTSIVQAAADLPDKAVERILFEASLQQDKITFITTMRVELDSKKATLTRIGDTFVSIQEHVPGYFRGLSGQCVYLCQVLEEIGTDEILDGKDTHWYSSMHHACRTFLRALDHVCAFIYLIFDVLDFDSEKRIRLDTRKLLCPRLRLILRRSREMSLGSSLGRCYNFKDKLLDILIE